MILPSHPCTLQGLFGFPEAIAFREPAPKQPMYRWAAVALALPCTLALHCSPDHT